MDSTESKRLKRNEYMRQWHAKNRDRIRDYNQLMYLAFPEKINASNRRSYVKHRVERDAATRRWNEANPEKNKQYRRRWMARNPHVGRMYALTRRILLKGATSSSNVKEAIKSLLLKVECYWCGCGLSEENRDIEHVTPLSRGGRHDASNLVASCRFCNRSKGNKLYWEWDGELAS